MENFVDVYDLGLMPYHKAWELQKRAQKRLVSQKKERGKGEFEKRGFNDMLFFTEHPHVYTLGKSGRSTNLLKTISELAEIDAEYVEIDRGGDITYHGPGQIVGYPILDLDNYFTDIHKYLRYLEEVIIRTCADYGVEAGRIEGLTGVWVGNEKICAMGIRCSRWVTMHGFALNIDTDLNYFNHIIPCGITDKKVTSLSKILNREIEMDEVKNRLSMHFAEIFNVKLIKQTEFHELTEKINVDG